MPNLEIGFPPRASGMVFVAVLGAFVLSGIPAAAATPNRAPVASDTTAKIDEDTPGIVELKGVDADGDKLAYLVVTPPRHGKISDSQNPHRVFFSPEKDYHGPDEFTYKVNDGQTDSAVAKVTIDILSYQDPPEAIAPTGLSTPENVPLTVTLDGRQVDPAGKLRFQIFADPEHGDLKPGKSQEIFVYTPHRGFAGEDHFIFAVRNDEYFSPEAIVKILVIPANRAPVTEPAQNK